ncbi:MAG: ATPase, T2SS/T4P/T4SS family, partial [Oscillospiraceae bacterium]
SRIELLSLTMRKEIGEQIFNSIRKMDVLEELLEDEEITEIMVNGNRGIFFEKEGRMYRFDKVFSSEDKLFDIVCQIAGESNRMVNETTPIVDTRLKDGSRVNIVLPPISLEGPIISIRKFPKHSIGMQELIEKDSLSTETAEFLKKLVEGGYNIFISGGTGSGKTTVLNALSEYIPKTERIVTIEDSAELQIRQIPNIVRLETRNANIEGNNKITIRDLIKTALRMRPDRIIVGEIRGPEAIDLLQAMNSGHDGSISTGHGNSSRDMLSRIETMVLMGMDLPLQAVRGQIAAAIDICIHLGRLRDGSRKLLEISQMNTMKEGNLRLEPIYRFKETGVSEGRIQGVWERMKTITIERKGS